MVVLRTTRIPRCADFSCNRRRDRKRYDAAGVVISLHRFLALLKKSAHNIEPSGFVYSRASAKSVRHILPMIAALPMCMNRCV